ncbi:MAG: exodeoxyribonuclease large subunit [Rickettsiaceae bacterium]|jgi:exodeoxyribonuclease VII large subunit|nr:exodeoxyribonuclease large subunit [Rickettsiaceae bacterium]
MPEIEQSYTRLPEFSVSEISASLKTVVEDTFPYVRVRGELSGYKRAPSGHVYMNLKDDSAVLAGVCWSGTASRFAFKPEDGLEVICTGRITTYPGQSKYQMVVDNMEPAGEGALMALLEKRKKQLAAEGLFDADRKQAIPFLPEVIGIVTSPTGAVIRDILHRLEDRFPRHVLLWPVLVQGEKAAEQIAVAIQGFNNMEKRPDVLIVARGGGSLEDLWPFNEEIVVRAVAASQIPVISAVGHETDTTLIDYVADLRAPTPTAAAEKAVPVRADLIMLCEDLGRRATAAIFRLLDDKQNMLKGLVRGLPKPSQFLDDNFQRLDGLTMRMANVFPKVLQEKQQKLYFMAKLLESYSYKKVLERGFAVVRDAKGSVILSAAAIATGEKLELEFHDGKKNVVEPTKQGSLF